MRPMLDATDEARDRPRAVGVARSGDVSDWRLVWDVTDKERMKRLAEARMLVGVLLAAREGVSGGVSGEGCCSGAGTGLATEGARPTGLDGVCSSVAAGLDAVLLAALLGGSFAVRRC